MNHKSNTSEVCDATCAPRIKQRCLYAWKSPQHSKLIFMTLASSTFIIMYSLLQSGAFLLAPSPYCAAPHLAGAARSGAAHAAEGLGTTDVSASCWRTPYRSWPILCGTQLDCPNSDCRADPEWISCHFCTKNTLTCNVGRCSDVYG